MRPLDKDDVNQHSTIDTSSCNLKRSRAALPRHADTHVTSHRYIAYILEYPLTHARMRTRHRAPSRWAWVAETLLRREDGCILPPLPIPPLLPPPSSTSAGAGAGAGADATERLGKEVLCMRRVPAGIVACGAGLATYSLCCRDDGFVIVLGTYTCTCTCTYGRTDLAVLQPSCMHIRADTTTGVCTFVCACLRACMCKGRRWSC